VGRGSGSLRAMAANKTICGMLRGRLRSWSQRGGQLALKKVIRLFGSRDGHARSPSNGSPPAQALRVDIKIRK